ncbi:MAG: BrnA antitoxin family protein [Pseudomonadota bacterium]
MPISKKRLAEIDAIQDTDIDTSDIPELDASFFETAKLVIPAGLTKKTVTMRMDEDVLEWFKGQGKGHLTRMNAVLRAYMLAQQDHKVADQ